jgi:hypothetical protein
MSYLKINVTREIRFVALYLVFFCWCLPYKRPAVISQHTCVPFATVYFFSFGIYPDETFHRARQRWLTYFPEKKNPSGIAGKGVSTTCCTPRQGTRKAGPSQFLRSFLIFLFPKIAAHFFKLVPDSSLRSIQFIFRVGAWKSCFT